MEIRLDSISHRWIVLADDLTEPEKFDDEIVTAISAVMKLEKSFSGTPTELTAKVNQERVEKIMRFVEQHKLTKALQEFLGSGKKKKDVIC